MQIHQIKAQLSILEVLDYYGLKGVSRNKSQNGAAFMLCCPFHDDKTPSLQIYPNTNTYCCFSSKCDAGTGDVIEFIARFEKISKREAILKAELLLRPAHADTVSSETKQLPGVDDQPGKQPDGKDLSRVALVAKFYQSSLIGFRKSAKAQNYAGQRGLATGKPGLNVGFIGDKVPVSWSDVYKAQAAELGLIIKKQSGNYAHRFRNCLVFALLNQENQPVAIYGRSITDKGHYYLPGKHNGLYPQWPASETTSLIFTESIIDAATLQQRQEIIKQHEVLALYGTNGLTDQHKTAISELKNLQEIIFFFDGDQAGRKAAQKQATTLKALLPDVKLSAVETPENEDINSLAQGHEPAIFQHLIENRKPLFFSIAVSDRFNKDKPSVTPAPGLDTSNPHKIIYKSANACTSYYIKGGLRHDLDSLKVSLDIENPQTGRKSRSKLDLYEDKQVVRLAREAAEKLNLRADLIELDIEKLTDLLEKYRDSQLEITEQDKGIVSVKVPPAVQNQCLNFLSKPNLIGRLNDLIGKAGVVGEEVNRIFLFGIATSYKMSDTLHALIQGSTGSGKTHLLVKISSFIPEEDCKRFTRVTESSFYNYGLYDLQHKLICLEDLDGMKEEAYLAFRELQSRGMLSSSTSGKDESGNIRAFEKVVYGPIASLSATTHGEIYEDNMSRCFLVAVDESKQQTQRIIDYQNRRAAGGINEKQQKEITDFLRNCIRMLKPYQVINPYADKVNLPKEAHKIRRLNELYQSYVKQITLLNQYRRRKDNKGRLISEKEDLQTAAEIMFESILLKIDELDGSLRDFYERLKDYIKAKGGENYQNYGFSQREIRQALNISKTGLHRFIHDLLSLEYIQLAGGYSNRGYQYKVTYWDNIAALRAKVKRHLKGQLDQLELVTA